MTDPSFPPPDDAPLPEPLDWNLVPELSFTNDRQEVNGHVKLAQAMLNEAGAFPALVIDGNFGQQTDDAVSTFQSNLGLDTSGIIDRDTWSALAFASPFPPLEPGPRDPAMTGPPVAALQELLIRSGAPAFVTGEFDQDTIDALDVFSNVTGRAPGNLIDPASWIALAQASSEPPPSGSSVFTFGFDSDFVANGQQLISFVGRIDNEDPGAVSEPLDSLADSSDFRAEWFDTDGDAIFRRRMPNPIQERIEVLDSVPGSELFVLDDPHPQGSFSVRLPIPPAAQTLGFFSTFGQGAQPTGSVLLASFNVGQLVASAAPVPVPPPFQLVTLHGDLANPQRRWTLVILSEGYTTGAEIDQFMNTDAPALRDRLLNSPLFEDVKDTINVVAIRVVSAESGQNLQPGSLTPLNTFFRVQYHKQVAGQELTSGVPFGDPAVVPGLLAAYPELFSKDVAAAVVINGAFPGGISRPTAPAGASPVAVASVAWINRFDPITWLDVALHEIGHAAFGLNDEYEEDDSDPSYSPALGLTADRGPNVTFLPNRLEFENFSKDAGKNASKPLIRIWKAMIDPNTPMPSTAPNTTAHRFGKSEAPALQPGVGPGVIGLFEGADHRSLNIFRAAATCKMRNPSQPFCLVCQAQIGSVLDKFAVPQFITHIGKIPTMRVTQFQRFAFAGTEGVLMYDTISGNYELLKVEEILTHAVPIPLPWSDTPQIEAGFSWLVPFDDGGTPMFIGIEFGTGRYAVHQVELSGDGVHTHLTKIFEFTPGGIGAITNLTTFVLGGNTHVIAYNRFNGAMRIDRIDAVTQPFTNVFLGSIQPGWTSVTTFKTSGGVFLLTYEVMNGGFKIQHLEQLGADFSPFSVGDPSWSPGFSHIQAYELNSRTYLIRHNALRGRTSIVRARNSGAGIDPRFEFDLPVGAFSMFGTGMPAFAVSSLPPAPNQPNTVLMVTTGLLGELRVYQLS